MTNFCLTLDDLSPHPRAGGDFKVLLNCDKLVKKYPNIKINLFLPAAYYRLKYGNNVPYFLSNHPEWVNTINKLPKKNYRINYHGMYHVNKTKHGTGSNNDEWEFLNTASAAGLMNEMMCEFKVAGIKAHRTFRAPGWKISKEASKVLLQNGFKIACLEKRIWDISHECDLIGDIIAFGHTSDWAQKQPNNYLDQYSMVRIMKLLDSKKFDFKFIEDM